MNIAITDKKFKSWLDKQRREKTNGSRRLESFETLLKRITGYVDPLVPKKRTVYPRRTVYPKRQGV